MRNVPIIVLGIVPAGMQGMKVDVSHHVLSMRYEDSDSKADRLTVIVDNEDLRNFDEPIWRAGNTMVISWGYPEVMTIERLMVIRKVSGFRQLTIEAAGGELAADRIQTARVFKDKTRSEMAQMIAYDWGYRDPSALHIEPTTQRYPVVSQGKMTDGQFLRMLAEKERYKWYIQHDGFHFHPEDLSQRTLKRFRYFADQALTEILDISLETDVTRVPGSIQARSYDPIQRYGIKIDATPRSQPDKISLAERREAGGVYDFHIPGLEDSAHHTIMRVNETAVAEVKRNADAALHAALKESVKLTMSVVGDPNIYAKTVIELEGVGKRLSQRYYVKTVTHAIGQGYITELECISDGSNGQLTKSSYLPETLIVQMMPPNLGRRAVDLQNAPARPGIKLDDGETLRAEKEAEKARKEQERIDEWKKKQQAEPPPSLIGPPAEVPPADDPRPVDINPVSTTPAQDKAMEKGNVDLKNRPYVKNGNDWSTTNSYTVKGSDGFWYLLPGVTDDGRLLNNEAEASDYYENVSGKHLGIYGSQKEANAAGEEIHQQQMTNPPNNTLGPTPDMSTGPVASL